jgi:hypothetical protein
MRVSELRTCRRFMPAPNRARPYLPLQRRAPLRRVRRQRGDLCVGGKRGYVKYGCHSYKHNGVCGNQLMIRQDRLEEQLIDVIELRILNPSTLNGVITLCEDGLRKRRGATNAVSSFHQFVARAVSVLDQNDNPLAEFSLGVINVV